ncbi:MAG: AraC family transcriptional regulator [Bacteroidaceae bacterium]|nr:AraC family transcriptional regulator [Bacteroidaceae bacterium]
MIQQEGYKAKIDDFLIREKRYRDPKFSANQLAEMLGVADYKLSRIMKDAYGMSYSEVVHTYRIQEAMHHLKNRRLSPYTVDDIGEMVGFKNRQSFFDAFKRITGTTPEKYRKSTIP